MPDYSYSYLVKESPLYSEDRRENPPTYNELAHYLQDRGLKPQDARDIILIMLLDGWLYIKEARGGEYTELHLGMPYASPDRVKISRPTK